jgi:hypothetical protein
MADVTEGRCQEEGVVVVVPGVVEAGAAQLGETLLFGYGTEEHDR